MKRLDFCSALTTESSDIMKPKHYKIQMCPFKVDHFFTQTHHRPYNIQSRSVCGRKKTGYSFLVGLSKRFSVCYRTVHSLKMTESIRCPKTMIPIYTDTTVREGGSFTLRSVFTLGGIPVMTSGFNPSAPPCTFFNDPVISIFHTVQNAPQVISYKYNF